LKSFKLIFQVHVLRLKHLYKIKTDLNDCSFKGRCRIYNRQEVLFDITSDDLLQFKTPVCTTKKEPLLNITVVESERFTKIIRKYNIRVRQSILSSIKLLTKLSSYARQLLEAKLK
jgi:hypothetical protein